MAIQFYLNCRLFLLLQARNEMFANYTQTSCSKLSPAPFSVETAIFNNGTTPNKVNSFLFPYTKDTRVSEFVKCILLISSAKFLLVKVSPPKFVVVNVYKRDLICNHLSTIQRKFQMYIFFFRHNTDAKSRPMRSSQTKCNV